MVAVCHTATLENFVLALCKACQRAYAHIVMFAINRYKSMCCCSALHCAVTAVVAKTLAHTTALETKHEASVLTGWQAKSALSVPVFSL